MNKENFTSERIYVNTYTNKQHGNDVIMTCLLGRPYTFKTIRLDQVSMENYWTTNYKSQYKNFTDLSFAINNGMAIINVPITVTQYIG